MRRRMYYQNFADSVIKKNYAGNLKGFGTQVLTIPEGFKGSTFGPANKGRKLTKEEIARYITAKKITEKHNHKLKK